MSDDQIKWQYQISKSDRQLIISSTKCHVYHYTYKILRSISSSKKDLHLSVLWKKTVRRAGWVKIIMLGSDWKLKTRHFIFKNTFIKQNMVWKYYSNNSIQYMISPNIYKKYIIRFQIQMQWMRWILQRQALLIQLKNATLFKFTFNVKNMRVLHNITF